MAGSERHANQLQYAVAPPLSIMTLTLYADAPPFGITIKKPHPVNRTHTLPMRAWEYILQPTMLNEYHYQPQQ